MKVICPEHGEILDTEDGIEAEVVRHDHDAQGHTYRKRASPLTKVTGVHASHDFVRIGGKRYCSSCDAPDNGCFASHFPCGFKFQAAAVYYFDEWRQTHNRTDQG